MVNAFEKTQLPPPSDPSPESPRVPVSGVREISPETREQSKDRYAERTQELLRKSLEIDQELPYIIGGDPMEMTIKMEKLNILANGTEDKGKRQDIGDLKGTNAITKQIFSLRDQEMIAYVKPRGGETTFRFYKATKYAMKGWREYNERTDSMVLEETVYFDPGETEPTDKNELESFRLRKNEYDYFVQRKNDLSYWNEAIARRYGIPIEEVPQQETTGYRAGIDANGGTVREYTASRLDLLLGFDVTLLTSLRKEHNGKDVSSSQEAFLSADTEQQIQPFISRQLFFDLVEQGELHPAWKSLMRVASFHYIIQHSDGHPANILYDPATHTFKTNDNGNSQGLHVAEEKIVEGEKGLSVHGRDSIVSIPIEIVDKHLETRLDDEAREQLRLFYESCMEYNKLTKAIDARRKERAASGKPVDPDEERREERMKEAHGREMKFFTSLMRLTHEQEKIAEIEGAEMLKRIKYLVDHGRPPYIPRGSNGGELYPFESEFGEKLEMAKTEHPAPPLEKTG